MCIRTTIPPYVRVACSPDHLLSARGASQLTIRGATIGNGRRIRDKWRTVQYRLHLLLEYTRGLEAEQMHQPA